MLDPNDIFSRDGDFVRFNQYGIKVDFDHSHSDEAYYDWLDGVAAAVGEHVDGGRIVEKAGSRSEPRFNTGVYYDTSDHRLLMREVVLRTTSNPKTHAFCAFKMGVDADGVRRDHRYVFDDVEKLTIQLAPTSEVAVRTVRTLLARQDIVQPGTILRQHLAITPNELSPALCLAQYRRTFYVWLDEKDALRCSLDRVHVLNLRPSEDRAERYAHFNEVELAIYPRIVAEVAADSRVQQLIDYLARSLAAHFSASPVSDSKYRRGAGLLGLVGDDVH